MTGADLSDMEIIATPPPLSPRPQDGHKGTFGRLLVVAGSEDMIGAPALAGTAALRMGAGLVQVAVPRTVLPAVLSVTPELVGSGLSKSVDKPLLLKSAGAADAMVLGPGLGQSALARARVLALIRLDMPAVVDADALNLLAKERKWPSAFRVKAVLTPHPGEAGRLAHFIGRAEVPTDDDGRLQFASDLARHTKQTIVLKGRRTVVTDGALAFINTTGDSTLAKAGTGDVLSGMLGCLLAQKMAPFDAACLAVHLHGLAGELAGKRLGKRCALARDVIDAIPAAVALFSKND